MRRVHSSLRDRGTLAGLDRQGGPVQGCRDETDCSLQHPYFQIASPRDDVRATYFAPVLNKRKERMRKPACTIEMIAIRDHKADSKSPEGLLVQRVRTTSSSSASLQFWDCGLVQE